MRTKIIPKFRVISIIVYEQGKITETYWWGYRYKMKENIYKNYLSLQQKRRFWFGYKTLQKSVFKDDLIDKMKKLKEIYGEYA